MSAATNDIIPMNDPPTNENLGELLKALGTDNAWRMLKNWIREEYKWSGDPKHYEALQYLESAEARMKPG